jgi:hypothetical protein
VQGPLIESPLTLSQPFFLRRHLLQAVMMDNEDERPTEAIFCGKQAEKMPKL